MNANDASSFQAKLGRERWLAARGAGDLLPELVHVDPRPVAKSPGKTGRAESSPTFIAGALPDFAGGAGGLLPHGSRALSLLFLFFY